MKKLFFLVNKIFIAKELHTAKQYKSNRTKSNKPLSWQIRINTATEYMDEIYEWHIRQQKENLLS